jgi:hypothetical protein
MTAPRDAYQPVIAWIDAGAHVPAGNTLLAGSVDDFS